MEKKFWIFGQTAVKVLFLLLISKSASADSSTPAANDLARRFHQLELQMASLQEEVKTLRDQLEIKGPSGEEKTVYVSPRLEAEEPQWLEGLSMGGDLRLRYDAFETNEAARDRNRFRYRLRWKIAREISKDLELGFRFVSGSATDPTSTNQTFTGDFGYKSIFIDQAYARYRPSFLLEQFEVLKKMEVAGGKFENPFLGMSSGLVWDADVMPEGAYEMLEFKFLEERLRPFVTLGQFILQENASSANDAELYGIQTGLRWNVPGFGKEADVHAAHAFAFYDFSDYARDSNFILSGTSLARGNTRTGSSTYLESGDFDILEIYNEFKFKVRDLPVKLFGDFAANLADRAADPLGRSIGYEYGIRLGEAKRKGDWEVTYYYAYIEPNAVVAGFNDSDFGIGGADKRGSAFKLGYKLTDSLRFNFTSYFVNNIVGSDDETRRFTSDLEWIF